MSRNSRGIGIYFMTIAMVLLLLYAFRGGWSDNQTITYQEYSEELKDGKITRRGVERMAKERVDDREYWEKRYKGYRFVKCYARYNNFNGYWYVSVVMYKTAGAPPKWDIKEWLEE